MIKNLLKKIKPVKRLYDGYNASKYFNHKYLEILRWIFISKEDTNYTYDLTDKNIIELVKTLEVIFPNKKSEEIKKYIEELNNDKELKEFINLQIKNSKFNYLADDKVYFCRRIGWYAIARISKPSIIVETGVDKGLGSLVLSRAIQKNLNEGYNGKYFGTDINPKAGYLFKFPYTKFGEILYGDSINTLKHFNQPIDLFINDSDHSADYEYNEYLTVENKLSPNAIILGDNSHVTNKLAMFSTNTNRNFLLFREEPKNHWYPGAGIGISFKK